MNLSSEIIRNIYTKLISLAEQGWKIAWGGIHMVGGISGLRFDVINSAGQTLTLSFSNLILQMDKSINDPNCPGSSIANLMAQAINEGVATLRGLMSQVLSYDQINYPNTFDAVVDGILAQKSSNCVSHGQGSSVGVHLTYEPAKWTNSCGVIFAEFNNNHISNTNGSDCE